MAYKSLVFDGMLQMTICCRCAGHFVAHAHDPRHAFICGLCQPPSRAGKTRKFADAQARESLAALEV